MDLRGLTQKKGNVGSENNLNIEDKTMHKILCNHEGHPELNITNSFNRTGVESATTKVMKIILTLLLLLIIPILTLADDIIYDKPYGGKKVGRSDNKGFIYDKPYGGKKIGRIEESGKLYDAPYGGKAVGRYKDGKVYNKPYGGKSIGRTDNKDGAGYWLLREKEKLQK